MRWKVAIRAGALALLVVSAPALAGPFHGHCGNCGTDECPLPRYSIKAEVEEHRYTVETPQRNAPVLRTKTQEKDVPCVRTVPVCVTDPVTGHTHTELQPKQVTEKVRYTVIEVCPPEKEWGTKKEEKAERCITISIQALPPALPAPCGPVPAH
jgi:hypothetical protein